MPITEYVDAVVPMSVVLTDTAGGNFIVPEYHAMRVQGFGAGGGGESADGDNGSPGGATIFGTMTANGGAGGGGISAGGTAFGGTINISGQTINSADTLGYRGGNSGGYPTYGGAEGGASNGTNGGIPGGGGAGHFTNDRGGAGGGGYFERTYAPGELAVGASIAWDVGIGGQGGTSSTDGGDGGRGEIRITIT